jgi:hypothetical protein
MPFRSLRSAVHRAVGHSMPHSFSGASGAGAEPSRLHGRVKDKARARGYVFGMKSRADEVEHAVEGLFWLDKSLAEHNSKIHRSLDEKTAKGITKFPRIPTSALHAICDNKLGAAAGFRAMHQLQHKTSNGKLASDLIEKLNGNP